MLIGDVMMWMYVRSEICESQTSGQKAETTEKKYIMIAICHGQREIQVQIQNGENRCKICGLYRQDADVQ
jgi:hypothetical protein